MFTNKVYSIKDKLGNFGVFPYFVVTMNGRTSDIESWLNDFYLKDFSKISPKPILFPGKLPVLS